MHKVIGKPPFYTQINTGSTVKLSNPCNRFISLNLLPRFEISYSNTKANGDGRLNITIEVAWIFWVLTMYITKMKSK